MTRDDFDTAIQDDIKRATTEEVEDDRRKSLAGMTWLDFAGDLRELADELKRRGKGALAHRINAVATALEAKVLDECDGEQDDSNASTFYRPPLPVDGNADKLAVEVWLATKFAHIDKRLENLEGGAEWIPATVFKQLDAGIKTALVDMKKRIAELDEADDERELAERVEDRFEHLERRDQIRSKIDVDVEERLSVLEQFGFSRVRDQVRELENNVGHLYNGKRDGSISTRLHKLEKAAESGCLIAGPADYVHGLERRLESLEKTVSSIVGKRLDELETNLCHQIEEIVVSSESARGSRNVLAELIKSCVGRLDELERRVRSNQPVDYSAHRIDERLNRLELASAIDGGNRPTLAARVKVVEHRVGQLEKADDARYDQLDVLSKEREVVFDRLVELEQNRSNWLGATRDLEIRIEQLERYDSAKADELANRVECVAGELAKRVDAVVEQYTVNEGRFESIFGRINTLEGRAEQLGKLANEQPDPSELNARLASLEREREALNKQRGYFDERLRKNVGEIEDVKAEVEGIRGLVADRIAEVDEYNEELNPPRRAVGALEEASNGKAK